MFPTTINRDIKRFVEKIKAGGIDPHSAAAKSTFSRLYSADPSFMAYDVNSLRWYIILNRLYHYHDVLAPNADL